MMLIRKREMGPYSGLPPHDENLVSGNVISVLICCLSLCKACNLLPSSCQGLHKVLCWPAVSFDWQVSTPPSCHNTTSVFLGEMTFLPSWSMSFGWDCDPHLSHSAYKIPLATVTGSRMGTWGLRWRPSGWDSTLPLQGAWVRSLLVEELRSHMLSDTAKKKIEWAHDPVWTNENQV